MGHAWGMAPRTTAGTSGLSRTHKYRYSSVEMLNASRAVQAGFPDTEEVTPAAAPPSRLANEASCCPSEPRPSPELLTIAARFEAPWFSPAVPDVPQAAVHNGRQRSMALTGRSRWPRSAAATAANAQLTAVPTGETPRLAAVGSWHCPPRRAPGARLPPAHAIGPGAGAEGPGVLPTLRRQRTPWRRREPGC